MQHYFVYILKCSDNSYYVGHTNNIESRLAAHNNGAIPDCYTITRRPLQLVYCEAAASRQDAFAFERQIKKWSRKKKEALIAHDWDEVKRLAKKIKKTD